MNITKMEVYHAVKTGLTSASIKNDLFARLQKGEDPVILLVAKIQNLYMKFAELQFHNDYVECELNRARQEVTKLNDYLSPKRKEG